MRSLRLLPAILLLSIAAACGSDDPKDPEFTGDPLATITSDSGALRLEIRTSPQPPTKGPVDVEVAVVDSESGAPVDDLSIEVSPWMGSMGHGSNTVDADALGEGRYLATGALFSMPGPWELRFAISGAIDDTAETPSFEVLP
ncbi:MAG TPA: FixH family protein [Vulgatibacter sp.]|nr:FixH family protein [Vulgatibacter sp.]